MRALLTVAVAAGFGLVGGVPQAVLADVGTGSGITAGSGQTCAVQAGKAYCWGQNYAGGLGDGTTTNSSVPVAVDTSGVLAGKTLTQISSSAATCALDTRGGAYCWGYNAVGGLGDGTTTSSTVPVAVVSLVPSHQATSPAGPATTPRPYPGPPRPAWAPAP